MQLLKCESITIRCSIIPMNLEKKYCLNYPICKFASNKFIGRYILPVFCKYYLRFCIN